MAQMLAEDDAVYVSIVQSPYSFRGGMRDTGQNPFLCFIRKRE